MQVRPLPYMYTMHHACTPCTMQVHYSPEGATPPALSALGSSTTGPMGNIFHLLLLPPYPSPLLLLFLSLVLSLISAPAHLFLLLVLLQTSWLSSWLPSCQHKTEVSRPEGGLKEALRKGFTGFTGISTLTWWSQNGGASSDSDLLSFFIKKT